MTNLTPNHGWDDVPQLETSTKALGGAGGPMNAQAQALLNRTEELNPDNQAAPETLDGTESWSFKKAGAWAKATTASIANFFATIAVLPWSNGVGAVARTLWARINDLPVSVCDFGAGIGGDDTAAFSAAIKAAPYGNSQALQRPNIPSADWTYLILPGHTYTLTDYPDALGREIVYLADPGAVINGSQFLNGRLVRLGSKFTDSHSGITDAASTLSIISNGGPDSQAKVSGFTDPSQLSAGNGRDSVALYVDNTAPPALYGAASVASYSAGGVTLSTPLTAAQMKQMRKGMIVQTRHTPQAYAGFVTSWAADGSSVNVSAWYLVDGSANGTPTTPTGTAGLDINAFRKAWAANANVFIGPSSYGNAANTIEFALQNTKGEAQSRGGPIEANCLYVTNLWQTGGYYGDAAYTADGRWTWGYKVNGSVTTAFYYAGDVNPGGDALSSLIYAKNAAGIPFYQVKPDGSMEIGLRGSGAASALNVDLHSGATDADYDVRLQASGGNGTAGGGTATLIAGTILLQGSTSIDAYTVLRPTADGTIALGQAGRRWSSANVVTGNFTNLNTANLSATGLQNFASDAAAAAGGVAIGGMYRNGSAVQVRVS